MRICLLSDTHNYLDPAIIRHAKECDEIWHAGDMGSIMLADKLAAIKPLRAVYGNIDGQDIRTAFNEIIRFNCGGMDVLMTHIGGKPGKYNPGIKKLLNGNPPALFICGHSHIMKVMFDKEYQMLFMNPGAAGNYGFHKVKTILRFTIESGTVKNLEVIEWKRNDLVS